MAANGAVVQAQGAGAVPVVDPPAVIPPPAARVPSIVRFAGHATSGSAQPVEQVPRIAMPAMVVRTGMFQRSAMPAVDILNQGIAFNSVLPENVIWFIVDSGANLHLVKDERVIVDKCETEITIQGITDSVQSSVSERIQGQVVPKNSDNIGVDLDVTLLPEIPNLFSVSAAIKKGHTVIHAGDAEHGKHGIFLQTSHSKKIFVPFVWCPDSNLWWLPILLNPINQRPAEVSADTSRGRRQEL